jgi:hypothetical protein
MDGYSSREMLQTPWLHVDLNLSKSNGSLRVGLAFALQNQSLTLKRNRHPRSHPRIGFTTAILLLFPNMSWN